MLTLPRCDVIIPTSSLKLYRNCGMNNFSTIASTGGSRSAATSKMEHFVIIVNDFKPLSIITKSIIHLWLHKLFISGYPLLSSILYATTSDCCSEPKFFTHYFRSTSRNSCRYKSMFKFWKQKCIWARIYFWWYNKRFLQIGDHFSYGNSSLKSDLHLP